MIRSAAIASMMILALAAPAYAQTAHLAVIVALAGDPEHGELFHKWASTLVDAASQRYGVPRDRVVYLANEPGADPERITGSSTRDGIAKAFEGLARAAADDPVMIVLIGHGSFDGRGATCKLP